MKLEDEPPLVLSLLPLVAAYMVQTPFRIDEVPSAHLPPLDTIQKYLDTPHVPDDGHCMPECMRCEAEAWLHQSRWLASLFKPTTTAGKTLLAILFDSLIASAKQLRSLEAPMPLGGTGRNMELMQLRRLAWKLNKATAL